MNLFSAKQPADWESGFEPRTTTKSRMSYKEYIGPLETLPRDKCQYRLLRLPNNMVVICISDPNSETAAAALTVGVGSYADPNDTLGLAHLLEHMLPMSSARYPEDESFEMFISNHSGSTNSLTGPFRTSYAFYIDNEALDGALDCMSDFLINPLLSAELIEDEVNAIDLEFQMQLTDDNAQIDWLKASLCSSNHPRSQFATGNKKTLDGSNPEKLRKKLVEFYNRYYSADIMKLAIKGKSTLDELTEMAVSRFSAVESKGITMPTLESLPLTKNELGKVIHFESTSSTYEFCLTFPLPDIRAQYRSQPIKYIAWLLSHEGSGSLTQYLYSQGLAINAAANIEIHRDYTIFEIHIGTTLKGLKQYDQVVSAVFAYLHMLSKSGPQEWIYNEISASYRLEFDYHEQPQPLERVTHLAYNATNEYIPPEHIASNCLVLSGFNSSLISETMELLNPTNYSVFIGAQSHEVVELSNTEKYYNVRYHVSDLPNTLTTDFCQDESVSSHFHLPKPNDFLPDDFSVPEPTGPRPKLDNFMPTLLKYNNGLELWYRQDDKFYLPKGKIEVDIKSPVINSSLRNENMLDLLCRCWRYMLNEELYSSECAGLSYSIGSTSTAVNITVEGFIQKLPLLLERVISNIRHKVIKESIFNDFFTRLQVGSKYTRFYPAIDQASALKKYINWYPSWESTLVEESFKDVVSYDKLNNFLHTLFEQVHIRMIVTGNFTEKQAVDAALNVQKTINAPALPDLQMRYRRTIQLDPGYYIFPKVSLIKGSSQSATIANIQLGKESGIRLHVIASVFHEFFYTQFSDQLHTREKLGNINDIFLDGSIDGRQMLSLGIEGECNPIYLSLRITEFLRTYRQSLVDFDEGELANIIEYVLEFFQKELEALSHETHEMWNAIESGNYNFGIMKEAIECLKTIGKQDIIEMWDKYISPDTAPQYVRVDIHIWPTNTRLPSAAELEKYPASVLALQRLLRDTTDSDINLEELNSFVKTASIDGNQDDAYKKLMTLYPVLQELAEESLTENNDGESCSS
ncbi:metalloprotease, partial [Coemansia sp. RSA 1365]